MALSVTCGACAAQFQIDENKLPAGKVRIKCPKCATPIEVSKPAAGSVSTPAAAASGSFPAPAPTQAPPPLPESAPSAAPAPVPSPPSPPAPAAAAGQSPELERQILGTLSELLKRGVRPEALVDGDEDAEVRRALVCDDEELCYDMLRDQLRALGYQVELAVTAADALTKVKNGGYELVTVDNRYPDNPEGGYEILRALASNGATARRKVYAVFISADLKTMDTGSAFFHGANLTINKKELRKAGALIRDGMAEYRRFYRVFHSVQRELQEEI